jgi:hypothetical protein
MEIDEKNTDEKNDALMSWIGNKISAYINSSLLYLVIAHNFASKPYVCNSLFASSKFVKSKGNAARKAIFHLSLSLEHLITSDSHNLAKL